MFYFIYSESSVRLFLTNVVKPMHQIWLTWLITNNNLEYQGKIDCVHDRWGWAGILNMGYVSCSTDWRFTNKQLFKKNDTVSILKPWESTQLTTSI